MWPASPITILFMPSEPERITAAKRRAAIVAALMLARVANPVTPVIALGSGFGGRPRAPPASRIRNRDCRRTFSQKWLDVDMTEPLPLLIESSIEIAWDYLNRTGELGDAMLAGRFLSDTIELMVRRGERRRLMLANKAIAAYQQFRRQQSVPPVLASA
jgi:hypothetical protein